MAFFLKNVRSLKISTRFLSKMLYDLLVLLLVSNFSIALRVEEEQNLPDSPDDAASSTGSDVGTGNFATAATLSFAGYFQELSRISSKHLIKNMEISDDGRFALTLTYPKEKDDKAYIVVYPLLKSGARV